MSDQAYAKVQAQQKTLIGSSPKGSLLQRTCACGQHTIAGGECEACRNERLTLHRSQRAFGLLSASTVSQSGPSAQENVPSFNSVVDRTPHFGHDFSQIPIHSTQTAVPQMKLEINQPGNVHGQGADRVAGQVMRTKLTVSQPGDSYEGKAERTAEQMVHTKDARTPHSMRLLYTSPMIQRTGASEAAKGSAKGPVRDTEEPMLDEKDNASFEPESIAEEDTEEIGSGKTRGNIFFKSRNGASPAAANPQRIQAQLGSGHSLDEDVKSRMELAFGQGFSQVRLHTDSRAAELARELNARAFAVGPHIAFRAGEYQPGTLAGDTLIAHELAHVVQQGGGATAAEPMPKGDEDTSAIERDADRSATGAVSAIWFGTKGTLGQIARKATPQLKSRLGLRRSNGTPSGATASGTACPPGPAWVPGKRITPTFSATRPTPKRSNTDPSTTNTDDPTFKGDVAVDCGTSVWHYLLDSVDSKGKIQLVYYTNDHYPAPTPTDDTGSLTNVTKANWKTIVADLSKNKAGIPDFWSAYLRETLHENYHWEVEWQGEVKKGLIKAEDESAKLTVDFVKAATAADAKKILTPLATKAFNDAMKDARTAYDALGDAPGDPPYRAQVPAIEAMIKRVKDYAKSRGWVKPKSPPKKKAKLVPTTPSKP